MVGMKLANIDVVKKGLGKEFKMKYLGEARFLLGIVIHDMRVGMFYLFRSGMHVISLAGLTWWSISRHRLLWI